MKVSKLTCPSCGAALEKPKEQTFNCPYCGSLINVEGIALEPSFLVKTDKAPRSREPLPELGAVDFPDTPLRKSPRGVVFMLFRALLFITEDWDKTFTALSYVLAKPTLEEHETTRLLRVFQSTPRVLFSYLGGTPENGYEHSPLLQPHVVEDACVELKEKQATIYIQSSGRKYASKIFLRQNKDGHWKVFEFSDLGIGVKPPTKVDDDF